MPRKPKVFTSEAPLAPIPAEILDQFVRQGPLTPEELEAVVRRFKKAIIERALGGELTHHLGYARGDAQPEDTTNHRNGTSGKTVLTDDGPLALDTSVLVPVFYGDHEHHAPSLSLFLSVGKKEDGCGGAHTLAEIYSTLTGMPGKYRVTGDQAMLFIGSILERLSVVALTAEEYAAALESWSKMGIVGGTIYDGLLASCALKSRAEAIYSWNLRHYRQLGPEVERRLKSPDAPKAL